MAIKRSDLIDNETPGFYRLISRCVRRVVNQTPTISTNTDTLNSQSLTRLVSIIRFLILFTVAK